MNSIESVVKPMRLECPHCRIAIEIIEAQAESDRTCPSCGSQISSELISTLIAPVDDQPPDRGAGFQPAAGDAVQPPVESSAPVVKRQVENLPRKTRPKPIENFGRFQLLKRLGGGAYGEDFWAYDPKLDREVAIKRPHERRLPPELAARFIREARATAQLKHPHIIGTYEVDEVDGRPYIASEYIFGMDLAALAEKERNAGRLLSTMQVAQLCGQVAEALHAAHEAGIVHRDLKPANILIGFDGVPRVMDFGMAKRDSDAEYVVTQAGQLLGSPAYMSPEQWQDSHAVDRRTDLWALGIILFELLTGERPFRGERDKKLLIDQILNAEVPPPSQLNSQVPKDLDTLCLKCLEKDPARRFRTTTDLAQELSRFVHHEPILSRPISRAEKAWRWCQRKPVIAGLSAAVVLSLLIGTIVSSYFAVREYHANKLTQRHLYTAHMNLAQLAWEDGRVGRVVQLLEQHGPGSPPDELRGFEWSYWQRLCHCDLYTLEGNTGGAMSVAFSPDGTRIVSASWNQVKVCNSATGQEIVTLKGNTGQINSVAFSPDGARIASATGDHENPSEIKLWDAATGQDIVTLKGRTALVNSVAFSPDGARIASASGDYENSGEVKLWDAVTGRETMTLEEHTEWVTSVAFSPDGKKIASASNDKTVRLSDVATGEEIMTLKSHSAYVNGVAFSPDGARIASASDDQTVRLWDATTGQELVTLKGHNGGVNSVAFSPTAG